MKLRMSSLPPPEVSPHVDGACHPNPGRGWWGVLLRSGSHEKRLNGAVPEESTTNQRAEIYAAVRALSVLKMPCRVHIFSDSQYLVRTMLGDYRRRSNLHLWEALDAVSEPHEVEWIWVRGHVGEKGNEIAHMLAESEA